MSYIFYCEDEEMKKLRTKDNIFDRRTLKQVYEQINSCYTWCKNKERGKTFIVTKRSKTK